MVKKPEPRTKPVLTIQMGEHYKTEVFMLNPGTGDRVERFGGSRHDLYAHKTATLVTREIGVSTTDVERDIYDPHFWEVHRQADQRRDRERAGVRLAKD